MKYKRNSKKVKENYLFQKLTYNFIDMGIAGPVPTQRLSIPIAFRIAVELIPWKPSLKAGSHLKECTNAKEEA